MRMKSWPLRLPVLAIICWSSIGAAYILLTGPASYLPFYPVGSGGNREFYHSLNLEGAILVLLITGILLSLTGVIVAVWQGCRHPSFWGTLLWAIIFVGALSLVAYCLSPYVVAHAVE